MTCRIQQADGQNWRFCPVGPPPAASRVQVIARIQLIDDLVLSPPLTAVAAKSTRSEFVARCTQDGLGGVIGRPYPSLPVSQVAGTPVGVDITAPGYSKLSVSQPLGSQGSYPASFTPVDLGTWRLQRQPIAVHGHVVRITGGVPQPVAGATVSVTAAVPPPPMAAAQPLPPAAATFLALSATTDAAGVFRLGPIARAMRLTLTASEGGSTASATVDLDYAQPVNLLDFVLP
jgi:hypothetical protein